MTESAMPIESAPTRSFQYSAQTSAGQTLSGTMQAHSANETRGALQSMGLNVMSVEEAAPPARGKPLSGDDFLAFNQQLADLTGAGLPMEVGLRLIAEDLRDARAAATIREIAADLERGKSLSEAISAHARHFPSLFSKVVAGGVAANNLPGLLLNLGRHLELIERLRRSLWRALTYPISVIIALCLLLVFVGMVVRPRFEELLNGFGAGAMSYTYKNGSFRVTTFDSVLPPITRALFAVSSFAPAMLVALAVVFIGLPILWKLLQHTLAGPLIYEHVFLRVPFTGGVLRRGAIARWCDAMHLAVEAGMDLPAALVLAGDVVALPGIRADSERLRQLISSGRPMTELKTWQILPPTIGATLQLAGDRGDLDNTLAVLARMYQQQAESRAAAAPALLMPILMFLIALIIGFILTGLFSPLLAIIQFMTR